MGGLTPQLSASSSATATATSGAGPVYFAPVSFGSPQGGSSSRPGPLVTAQRAAAAAASAALSGWPD